MNLEQQTEKVIEFRKHTDSGGVLYGVAKDDMEVQCIKNPEYRYTDLFGVKEWYVWGSFSYEIKIYHLFKTKKEAKVCLKQMKKEMKLEKIEGEKVRALREIERKREYNENLDKKLKEMGK